MVDLKRVIKEGINFGFGKTLQMEQQTEAAECGLACVAMIASFHGHVTDVATLRRRFPISLKGATLNQIIEVAGQLNLATRPLRLEMDELSKLQLPCILHWNLDHFVVLKQITSKGIVVHDPARGVRRYSFADTSKAFSGVALEFTPTPGFQRKVERREIGLRKLLGKVTGLKRSLFQIALLSLSLEVLTLVGPFFNQWVVDTAVVTSDQNLLLTLVIGFGLLKLINVAIEAMRGYAILVMSSSLNVQWLANLFTHLLKLPVDYFQKRHMGDIVSRFNAVHVIQSTLTTGFVGAVIDGILAIGTLVMMIVYSTTLTYIAVGAALLYLLLRFCFYAALIAATEGAIEHEAKHQSLFMETLRGIQSIRLFAKEKERAQRWLNAVIGQKNQSIKGQQINLLFQSGKNFLFGVEEIIVFGYGAKLVIEGQFSLGMSFAFLAYKKQFTSRVSGLVDKLFELSMLRMHGSRLADIALAEPERDGVIAAHDIENMSSSLEIENVTFMYGTGEKPVLWGVNLRVEAGESLAIIGPSGCGKSTLLKIILGILHPSAGQIKVGGIPLRNLGMNNYRKMIGTVMQDDALFAGTIADNISFFAAEPDQKWIEQCARLAALHDEISAMPMGYNSFIGDMGSVLSGGQRQRLLLARALYRKPRILILDEATSNLDPHNDRVISEVVKKLAMTRIIVAHRSDMVGAADRVVMLNRPDGKSPAALTPVVVTPAVPPVSARRQITSSDQDIYS